MSNNSPAFSRFEINMNRGDALPIYPLQYPDNHGSGVALVGDYVANDFVDHHTNRDSSFRDRWMIVSTTQSDAVPHSVDKVDLNLFSNQEGVQQYLEGAAGRVPYSLDIADGLFVDPELFKPAEEPVPQDYDLLYVAKWYPTKETDLLLDVATDRPDIRIGLYGWLMASERKRAESQAYREHILGRAATLPNVITFDTEDFSHQENHTNPDGSVVLGPLSKKQMRDSFYYRSGVSMFLSAKTEAVNRSTVEMTMCDKPSIVALPTSGGMERFMTDKTTVFCERTPKGIIRAYDTIKSGDLELSPRASMLEIAGREKTNDKLQKIVQSAAEQSGRQLSEQAWNTYGGDLWTTPETYGTIR